MEGIFFLAQLLTNDLSYTLFLVLNMCVGLQQGEYSSPIVRISSTSLQVVVGCFISTKKCAYTTHTLHQSVTAYCVHEVRVVAFLYLIFVHIKTLLKMWEWNQDK